MAKVTITYSYDRDEVAIRADEDFLALPAIHRADALRDALHDLEIIYGETVKQIGKDAA